MWISTALHVSLSETVTSADFGDSSKYSKENFEGRSGERFHLNSNWTQRVEGRGDREAALHVSLSETVTSAHLGGSSNYSNENFDSRSASIFKFKYVYLNFEMIVQILVVVANIQMRTLTAEVLAYSNSNMHI